MSTLPCYLANYLAISKLQGRPKLLNRIRNMRVTLHTLQFSQSTVETSEPHLCGLRLICVDVSDRQLRKAQMSARERTGKLQGEQVQDENVRRLRGSSISLQGARWLQGKSKRVERQTPPTAEILEPLGRCFSWLASNLRLVL
jgi:hypothetical protein